MTHFNSALDGHHSTRLARKAARLAAIQRFGELLPGESASFDLPEGQPAKRDTAVAIASAAARVFGRGRVTVKTTGAQLVVTRLEGVL